MKIGTFPVERFKDIDTPFYYYDMELLKETLKKVKEYSKQYNYVVHYAVKANANKKLLEAIAVSGLGADCVSGNEVKVAVLAGFPSSKIVFAGVGKTDKEIKDALDMNIACFNVESLPELEAINEIAKKKGKTASVALRVNPNIDAKTHKYITTGVDENKFGFNVSQLDDVLEKIQTLKQINLIGVHYHIGSQIEDLEVFKELAKHATELQMYFQNKGINLEHINMGGGLGVDYANPEDKLIPDFESYFKVFSANLNSIDKRVHFELGRSIVAQCGSLITRTTYVKEGISKEFVVLDAGMSDLIRPALYQAQHKIENLTSNLDEKNYDVVGPICESADTFGQNYTLNETKRGDIMALRSAGAYGEVMASRYNLRELPKSYFSDLLCRLEE